jgi:hypothetical protein
MRHGYHQERATVVALTTMSRTRLRNSFRTPASVQRKSPATSRPMLRLRWVIPLRMLQKKARKLPLLPPSKRLLPPSLRLSDVIIHPLQLLLPDGWCHDWPDRPMADLMLASLLRLSGVD